MRERATLTYDYNNAVNAFYKIINELALVETDDILTPTDSRTRKSQSFKFKHLQANCDSYRLQVFFLSSHHFELEQPSIWHFF